MGVGVVVEVGCGCGSGSVFVRSEGLVLIKKPQNLLLIGERVV